MEKLSAENVYYSYQGKYQKFNALKDVCCEFEKGKMYAIIGPSGCGKTTLLSVLAGLTIPESGEIKVDNEIVKADDLIRHRRDNVSVIYQSFHLFTDLTILENVMFPMLIIHEKKTHALNKAKLLLRDVGINEDYFNKFPSMISGGEQQRVAIARALASRAKFILGDEPTGNLDSGNSKMVMDIFKNLLKENYCIILVTHDLNIAKQADVVYKMIDGVLTQSEIE